MYLDDKDERKTQIKMRKIELFIKNLDDEMLMYSEIVISNELEKRSQELML